MTDQLSPNDICHQNRHLKKSKQHKGKDYVVTEMTVLSSIMFRELKNKKKIEQNKKAIKKERVIGNIGKARADRAPACVEGGSL